MRFGIHLFALGCAVAVASPAGAQSSTNDSYVPGIMHALSQPSRWSLSANLATNSYGTFMMQNVPGGERALRGNANMGWGLAAGFDLADQLNLRLGWSYTNSNMRFQDFNGNGSGQLDSGDLGKLTSNIAALDVVHYFVGSRSLISPYAGAGVAGVWSSLGPNSTVLVTPGGTQQFHLGINANVGVQVRIIPQWFGRVELNSMGTSNPFNGNRSYKSNVGTTFDEPTRVSKTEWRFATTYYFGKTETQPATTAARTQ